jgi:ribosome modulation factor
MMETYYKLGRKAREEGKGKKNNPYSQPNFFRSWRAGWEDSDSEIG